MPPGEPKQSVESKPKTIRVEMTECVAGRNFVHRPGKQYDLPAATAENYIAKEIAVRVVPEA